VQKKNLKKFTPNASQNEVAYARLKEALITLVYKPGEYINLAQLMERMELGRTPLHQALHRLSTEGLIQIIPRKGAMAAPLSIDDALELIEVRMVNETLCMQLAAKKINATELRALESAVIAFEKAAAKRDLVEMMTTDRLIHEKIATAAHNAMLKDILDVLHARSQRFWAMSFSTTGHIAEVINEHQAILSALKEQDAEAGVSAIKKHIDSFRDSLLSKT
jgi:DNA-binding GntR family transcriptional regulator